VIKVNVGTHSKSKHGVACGKNTDCIDRYLISSGSDLTLYWSNVSGASLDLFKIAKFLLTHTLTDLNQIFKIPTYNKSPEF